MYTEQEMDEMDEMDEGFDPSVPCSSICRDCGTPIPPSGRHDCIYDREETSDGH